MLAAGVLVAAGLTAGMAVPAMASGRTTTAAGAQSAVDRAADLPFLFNYVFNRHLKIGGGNFTDGGRVYLAVKLNSGSVMFKTDAIAQTHPITPGGAIYVETTVAAPCASSNNGYAVAYDYTTGQWTPRLPVGVCVAFD